MNEPQKKYVRRIVGNIFVVAVLLTVFSVFYERIPPEWLSDHRRGLYWAGVAFFIVGTTLAKHRTPIPTRAERHAAFNELMDDYPLLKLFYVVYAALIVSGVIYMLVKHIYVVDILDKTGFLGLVAPVALLGVPVGIAGFLRSYEQAGREER